MIRPPFDQVVGALVDVGQPILREDFTADCCIAATRLATRVLELTGHAAHAQVMWARAGNAAFCEAVENDRPVEEWPNRAVQFVEIDTDTSGSGRFAGHLVAISRGTLIDLSAGQFNRPKKRIHVPESVALELPDEWETGTIGRKLDGGGILMYRPFNGEGYDYRRSPNWSVTAVGRSVQATLDALDEGSDS